MKRIVLIIIALFICSIAYASNVKYIIHLEDGKVISCQKVTQKYLSKHAGNATSPVNREGAIIVDSLEGYEMNIPILPTPEETLKESLLKLLDDEDVKTKVKNIKSVQ